MLSFVVSSLLLIIRTRAVHNIFKLKALRLDYYFQDKHLCQLVFSAQYEKYGKPQYITVITAVRVSPTLTYLVVIPSCFYLWYCTGTAAVTGRSTLLLVASYWFVVKVLVDRSDTADFYILM